VNVLFLSAFVGAVLATAISVVISAMQPQEKVEEAGVSVAARRSPVR
jgi:hypothetical protein